jgi:hypothetical protein
MYQQSGLFRRPSGVSMGPMHRSTHPAYTALSRSVNETWSSRFGFAVPRLDGAQDIYVFMFHKDSRVPQALRVLQAPIDADHAWYNGANRELWRWAQVN